MGGASVWGSASRQAVEVLLLESESFEATHSGLGPSLSATPEGCERLYQKALDKLRKREFEAARQIAIWAMRGALRTPAYRALVHRTNAEEALANGQITTAERELAVALSLVPDDEELRALADRFESAPARRSDPGSPRRSFFSRLFTKE
jgi:hypothetical protein